MARKKSTETIDAGINKVKSDMSRLQDRYDKLADKLKDLQDQKRQIEADTIMDAYLKSGKSLEEVMTFLNP
jgi:phage shock protein A